MKLGIVGSRKFTNEYKIRFLIEKYVEKYGSELIVVSGGCPNGGDFLAKKVALDMNVAYQEFPPIHSKHNQYCILPPEVYNQVYHVGNFFTRNTQIAEYCDHIFGFIVKNIEANGTMDTINKSKKLGKKTFVFEG